MLSVRYDTVFTSAPGSYAVASQAITAVGSRSAYGIPEEGENIITAVALGALRKIAVIRIDPDTDILPAFDGTCQIVGKRIAERVAEQQHTAESGIRTFCVEKAGRFTFRTDKLTPLERPVHSVIVPFGDGTESDIDRINRNTVVVDRLTAENNSSRHAGDGYRH